MNILIREIQDIEEDMVMDEKQQSKDKQDQIILKEEDEDENEDDSVNVVDEAE